MAFSPLIGELIQALRCLPGVGPKSAQRMAFHLLQRNVAKAQHLADCLQRASIQVGHCQRCHTLVEFPICAICSDTKRDTHLLCIVESPSDVLAIEQTGSYHGLYFVLLGHLSPIDGIGPEHLGLDDLIKLLRSQQINEVILATNPTVEGEATAHYLAQLIKQHSNSKVSRIAHGVPMGGELEYIDGSTLALALNSRDLISEIR